MNKPIDIKELITKLDSINEDSGTLYTDLQELVSRAVYSPTVTTVELLKELQNLLSMHNINEDAWALDNDIGEEQFLIEFDGELDSLLESYWLKAQELGFDEDGLRQVLRSHNG